MTEPPTDPVRATGAGRRFGRRWALRGLDLRVGAGEIVGLVGPNGSGKTTLFRLLAGLLQPSEGDVRVYGRDPFRERARVMERVRFAFAPPALFGKLNAREHLRHLARIRAPGTPAVERAELDRALETVGLAGRASEPVRTFSFGMRQRLALAQALVPLPRLIVLDEPTDGLDPLAILELREVLKRLREEHGVAILLSSHLLVEVGELVDRMLVLAEGETLFSGTPDELCRGSEGIELEVAGDPVDDPGDDPAGHSNGVLERARDALVRRGLEVDPGDMGNGQRCLRLRDDAVKLSDVAGWMASEGVELVAFRHVRPSLEQALLRRLREAQRAEGSST